MAGYRVSRLHTTAHSGLFSSKWTIVLPRGPL
jgi:hypothetical protein